MYNIYVEEKRKKDIESKQKEEQKILKYKERFQSKKINLSFSLFYRTNTNNVSKL